MENQNEYVRENDSELQATPPPENNIEKEPPQMSEPGTLGNIFFEPAETFEDLRRKPRFLIALLIMTVLITAFTLLFFSRIGDERIRRNIVDQLEKNPAVQSMTPEQKRQQVEVSMTISSYVRYALPVFILIGFAIGGLLYWLGGKAMGGTGGFLHGLSAYVYASFPPTVILMLANIVVLFLKDPDDIDFAASQRGVVHANPSFLFDGKESPVLTTLISTLDLFSIWGWVLAAIGLHKIMKISKGSAWAVVLIFALLGVAYRVVSAYLSGNPM
jgi:hypothetical protein